ncbi:hypothetical protein E4U41_002247, partial [Claviceps citrina]
MYSRESKIMRKLLGKATPDAATGELASVPGTTTPIPPSFRPFKSREAVYSAGAPIFCFDVSSDRRAVIFAGPHILKAVFRHDPASTSFIFKDGIDVRAVINTRQSKAFRSNMVADQLNIRDVKWHNGSYIYTACASGKVFSYDLTRLASGEMEPLEYILMHEDSRQMNTLDINPHLQTWLLTGGQDGTARIFDSKSLTRARHGVTFKQRFAPLRCIDPIVRVSWSPKHGHEMACGTDGGVIMKWDVRQPSRPVLRINAHEKACSTIAWHPDGQHLLSAGWDTKMQVWDLGDTADKRQKPKFTISAPAPAVAVAWRPGTWSASAQARRAAQVAVTYDENSNRKYGTSAVHVWDFARPSMPYKEIESFDACPSAIWWQGQDLLWTVGPDGAFNQRDVAFARKPVNRQSTSAMAFSPRGDALLFLDGRSESSRLRFHETHTRQVVRRATYSSSPGNAGLSLSRSDSEDDVLDSFLGRDRRTDGDGMLSGRGGVPLSTTPPSGEASSPDDANQTLGLEQSVNLTGAFKPQQAMSFGHIPAAMSVQVYHFMSRAYLDTLRQGLPYVEGGKNMAERVGDMMEQFAEACEDAHLYRLAQTWRILALAMDILLKRRARYHFEVRIGQFQRMCLEDASRGPDRPRPTETLGNEQDTPRHPSGQRRSSVDGRLHSIRSLLAEEIESTSNVPTPVARPADGGISSAGGNKNASGFGQEITSYSHGRRLSPIAEPERLSLEPAAHEKRLDSEPVSEGSGHKEESGASCTEGYDYYDAEALAKAIDVPMTRREEGGKGLGYGGETARHDSDDSLGQMFSISSGTRSRGRMGSSGGGAFARPGLTREQSDLERDSGASSSQDSPVMSGMPGSLTEKKNGPSGRAGELREEQAFMIPQTTTATATTTTAAAAAADEEYACQSSFSSQGTNEEDSSLSPHSSPALSTDSGRRRRCRQARRKEKEPVSARHDARLRIVETDYLPWNHDAAYPYPVRAQDRRGAGFSPNSPLEPYSVLLKVLDYESRTCALHASAIILLLKPLVPESVIDTHRATAILRQHHRRLMQMSLFVEAALVRNMCVRGWPDGLPDWGENYACIFGSAQQGVRTGPLCWSCRKPREVDPRADVTALWTCERCKSLMAPCSVCGHREAQRPSHIPAEVAPSESDVESDGWLSEWSYCPVCAHGGHASCLQLWHGASEAVLLADASIKYSDGCCPADGCGHACLPGKYRSESSTARSDELGRAAVEASRAREERNRAGSSRGGSGRSSPGAAGLERGVCSDGHEVPQSRA